MPGSHGEARVIRLDDSLASGGITLNLPGVERFRVAALTFALTTAGGGADRQVVAQLRDSTGATVYGIAAPGLQASGLSVVYSFAPGVQAYGSGALGFMGGPFPGSELPENLSLFVQVVSAGGGDTLSEARLLVWQTWRLDPAS